MNKVQKEFIKQVAGRMIGSYIQAVEQDDLNKIDCWIHYPEHWEFDLEEGKELLKLIGLSNEEVETEVNNIRFELGEDEEDDNPPSNGGSRGYSEASGVWN